MAERKHYFLPKELNYAASIQKSELDRALGIRKLSDRLINGIEDQDVLKTLHSLDEFRVRANATGFPEQILKDLQAKQNISESHQIVVAEPIFGEGYHRIEGKAAFTADSKYSLIIGARQSGQNRWLAGIGFDLDQRGCPVISQIQACSPIIGTSVAGTFDDYEKERDCNKSLLARFRWEFLLVALVAKWAQIRKAKEVRIKPAAHNIWRVAVPDERLKLRYDVTAKRMGFKFDKSTWDWKLDLQET